MMSTQPVAVETSAPATASTASIEISWNVPYTPSPIDFCRRRQHTLYINNVHSTLPIKRRQSLHMYIMKKSGLGAAGPAMGAVTCHK